MVSLADQEFQHELCEFGLNPHKVADVDDDGKPRRTGDRSSLSQTHKHVFICQNSSQLAIFVHWIMPVCYQTLHAKIVYIYDNLDDIYVIPDE